MSALKPISPQRSLSALSGLRVGQSADSRCLAGIADSAWQVILKKKSGLSFFFLRFSSQVHES